MGCLVPKQLALWDLSSQWWHGWATTPDTGHWHGAWEVLLWQWQLMLGFGEAESSAHGRASELVQALLSLLWCSTQSLTFIGLHKHKLGWGRGCFLLSTKDLAASQQPWPLWSSQSFRPSHTLLPDKCHFLMVRLKKFKAFRNRDGSIEGRYWLSFFPFSTWCLKENMFSVKWPPFATSSQRLPSLQKGFLQVGPFTLDSNTRDIFLQLDPRWHFKALSSFRGKQTGTSKIVGMTSIRDSQVVETLNSVAHFPLTHFQWRCLHLYKNPCPPSPSCLPTPQAW